MSCIVLVLPWTGFPFGFIRLCITVVSLISIVFSIGLYQKEQKIALWIRDVRISQLGDNEKEVQSEKEPHTVLERKKLSDVLSS